MAFDVKDWRNYPDTTTPISASALEDLEERVTLKRPPPRGFTASAPVTP